MTSPLPWLAWGVMTAGFGISGPFATYEALDLVERLGFWAVVIGTCILCGITGRAFLKARYPDMGAGQASVIVAAVCAPILALAIFDLIGRLYPAAARQNPEPLELMLMIFIIGVGIAMTRRAFSSPAGLSWDFMRAGVTDTAPRDGPRLWERLAPALRGGMVRVSARDHYLDVVTDKGGSEVLMRFSDAVAELEGVDGLQVHRSHWVAVRRVTGAETDRGKLFLLTSDGARLPVSQTYRAAVEARGLHQLRAAGGKGTSSAERPVRTASPPEGNSLASSEDEDDKPPV